MNFNWKRGVLAGLLVVILALAIYFTTRPVECLNFECFQDKMIACSPAVYINEENDALWKYEVKGMEKGMCKVEVTLLSAKEGSLKLRQYEGNSMNCLHDKGIALYPEKDLEACTGELKENLQSLIINKLYEYIIDNLGEINEELKGI